MITPALIFCAWLLILATTAPYQCPEECSCDAGGFTVECVSLPLNTTPVAFPKYVRILSFYSYNLIFLRKDNFLHSKLTQLENLGIDECGIESVESGAFNGLIMLINLSMKHNKISKIERLTVENVKTLERLNLRSNRITNLEPDTFLGLRNLRIIQLDNKKIEYFHLDMLINASHLDLLSLTINPLQKIPTDCHFISSPSLRHLDLSHCNIRSVSVAKFSKVRNLNELNLFFNDLKNTYVNIVKISLNYPNF
jgi:Leucine-rich repeat (LRR) protein